MAHGPQAVLQREVVRLRRWMAVSFCFVALAVMIVCNLIPRQYSSNAMLEVRVNTGLSADQLFESLHALVKPVSNDLLLGQSDGERLSLEWLSDNHNRPKRMLNDLLRLSRESQRETMESDRQQALEMASQDVQRARGVYEKIETQLNNALSDRAQSADEKLVGTLRAQLAAAESRLREVQGEASRLASAPPEEVDVPYTISKDPESVVMVSGISSRRALTQALAAGAVVTLLIPLIASMMRRSGKRLETLAKSTGLTELAEVPVWHNADDDRGPPRWVLRLMVSLTILAAVASLIFGS